MKKPIGTPVTVNLQSTIEHPDQATEQIQLTVKGQIIEKGSTFYLRYEEQEGAVRTVIKLIGNEAVIIRSGAVTMRLPLVEQELREGQYGSGPAQFPLHIHTERVVHKPITHDTSGEFLAIYTLQNQGQMVGSYQLLITYTEVQS